MNTSEFQVSVVTPVYNAARFLPRSVEAAVSQQEVGEVILVEDASPDDSLEVCRQLATKYPRVRLLQHPDKQNHGAGATRNLGIHAARFDYIAFADADNFYLPNRFTRDKEIFASDPTADGVYGAEGIYYYSEKARQIFASNIDGDLRDHELLTLSAPCPPEELVHVWLLQHATIRGVFGMDAITVRRSLFEKSGFFEPSLRLQQDHDLFTRMAAVGRLVPGIIDRPIAIRGVHENQRMTNMELQRKCSVMRMDHLYRWFRRNVRDRKARLAMERAYWKFRTLHASGNAAIYPTLRTAWAYGIHESMRPYGLVDQGLLNAFGNRRLPARVLAAKRRLGSLLLQPQQLNS
jgi:glycosyltransferase involved in cell wall biosynthesis